MKTKKLIGLLLLMFFLSIICGHFSLSLMAAETPAVSKVQVEINGKTVLPSNGTAAGVWLFTDGKGVQLLLLGHPKAGLSQEPNYKIIADLDAGQTVRILFPVTTEISCRNQQKGPKPVKLEWSQNVAGKIPVVLTLKTESQPGIVELDQFERRTPISLDPLRRGTSFAPVETSPDLRPALADALIEWDWQMHDGVDAPIEPRTWQQALKKRIPQGTKLLEDLAENEDIHELAKFQKEWQEKIVQQYQKLVDSKTPDSSDNWKSLWREMHLLKRSILLANPLFEKKPILFTKHASGVMSHQLTQVYGYAARPGGGLYLLESPGVSMKTRPLTGSLPTGSYMHPELSFDGKKIYFAFCEGADTPKVWRDPKTMNRHYHLYSINSDGTGLRKLTDGNFDDFSPTCLPDGDLIFISTRRGGFHRCGGGPCFVYTLAKMKADGTDPHVISFHETNEWNPTVLANGRVVYTRWDYVDRDAVFYQNLWSTRQDGTDVRIHYGNNTFNPCGIWETKAIPGSGKIMAVGAPHHGMSAGSLIMIDSTLGVDGSKPVTRLTPEVLYPEGEVPLPMAPNLPTFAEFDMPIGNCWNAWNREDRPAERIREYPEEQRRWPVHCFKSPWPLSEKYFIASYSFDKLLGEAGANIPNQFGIYFCDAFGNRELIYRDPNISSIWAIPLVSRPVPAKWESTLPADKPATGRFFLQNVYESWPNKLPDKVHSLRIVQVLPKTTPNANQPKVGAANASPGKQVLGTVPVADDGSAWFEVPAKTPILFQALDEKGRMIQGMRSLVYLQPGEVASCTGCHEDRMSSSPVAATSSARQQVPSQLKPGPDGSNPLSFQIMVQPVLEKHCVSCHNDAKAEGKINLTKSPDGAFSKAYNALIPYVRYTAWGLPNGNDEPMTLPDCFGARASKLTKLLDKGHYDCKLTSDDWDRLNTWMDTNALFYGTFNVENQKRQLNGERIKGPDLQ